MRSGVPHRGELPGQPGRVTRLAGVSFLHVKAEGGVTRLAGVMSIRHLSTWLPTTTSLASFSDDFIFKTSRKTFLVKKILKKLTVPATI